MDPYDSTGTPTSYIYLGNDGTRGVVKVLSSLSTAVSGAFVLQPQNSSGVTVYLYAEYAAGKTDIYVSDTDPASGRVRVGH